MGVIVAECIALDKLMQKIEHFLTLHLESAKSGHTLNRVKMKAEQVNFIDNTAKVRNIIVKQIHSKEMMKSFFHNQDRAARLIYVHDTIMENPGESIFLSKMSNFKKTVEDALALYQWDVPTWRELWDKGDLKVGFGVAATAEVRDMVLEEEGIVAKPETSDIPVCDASPTYALHADLRFADTPIGRLSILQKSTIISRSDGAQATRRTDDECIGITSSPIPRFEHGYYVEVQVADMDDAPHGCMGLGVTCMNPDAMEHPLPKRLEKMEQGWFFTGPYKGGTTRRVYRHGKKDIRFILDGEEVQPLRWSVGDKMSILVRPKDWLADEWQWTVSLYINRNIVLACTIDVPPLPNGGGVPKELSLFAVAEGYGYVKSVELKADTSPIGLAIAGLKNEE